MIAVTQAGCPVGTHVGGSELLNEPEGNQKHLCSCAGGGKTLSSTETACRCIQQTGQAPTCSSLFNDLSIRLLRLQLCLGHGRPTVAPHPRLLRKTVIADQIRLQGGLGPLLGFMGTCMDPESSVSLLRAQTCSNVWRVRGPVASRAHIGPE